MDIASTTVFIRSECAGGHDTGGSHVGYDKGVNVISMELEESEKFVISTCNMDICDKGQRFEDVYKAMIDQGANVNLGPLRLAKMLGLLVVPHTDGRKIGTADAEGHMDIEG